MKCLKNTDAQIFKYSILSVPLLCVGDYRGQKGVIVNYLCPKESFWLEKEKRHT